MQSRNARINDRLQRRPASELYGPERRRPRLRSEKDLDYAYDLFKQMPSYGAWQQLVATAAATYQAEWEDKNGQFALGMPRISRSSDGSSSKRSANE